MTDEQDTHRYHLLQNAFGGEAPVPADVGGFNGLLAIEIDNTGGNTFTAQFQGRSERDNLFNANYVRQDDGPTDAPSQGAITILANAKIWLELQTWYPEITLTFSKTGGTDVVAGLYVTLYAMPV